MLETACISDCGAMSAPLTVLATFALAAASTSRGLENAQDAATHLHQRDSRDLPRSKMNDVKVMSQHSRHVHEHATHH